MGRKFKLPKVELTPEQVEFGYQLTRAADKAASAVDHHNKLLAQCKHALPKLSDEMKVALRKCNESTWGIDSLRCVICEAGFGWTCPDSPDQVCHYLTEVDGKVELIDKTRVDPPADHDPEYETYDSCIFCGQPYERK